MAERVDWSKRADYIRRRHGMEPSWATEAVEDGEAVWLRPDPASASGLSVRVVGYAASAETVLTVILLPTETDPHDRPDGDWWGVNAWQANTRDQRLYTEGE